jgi:pyruvate dehydrogenase E1 component alpha subunit/2-oxoisovalerate dehydrogenase E1 component alpha subunit
VRVDGNDVLAVYRAVSDAVYRARQGEGPTFIECVTYRIGGHSTSDDPSRYRAEHEVSEWVKRDPIARFQRHLQYLGLLSDAFDAELEQEIEREISQAIEAVERSPRPGRESLFDDVYATLPWHLQEQRRELERASGFVAKTESDPES